MDGKWEGRVEQISVVCTDLNIKMSCRAMWPLTKLCNLDAGAGVWERTQRTLKYFLKGSSEEQRWVLGWNWYVTGWTSITWLPTKQNGGHRDPWGYFGSEGPIQSWILCSFEVKKLLKFGIYETYIFCLTFSFTTTILRYILPMANDNLNISVFLMFSYIIYLPITVLQIWLFAGWQK